MLLEIHVNTGYAQERKEGRKEGRKKRKEKKKK